MARHPLRLRMEPENREGPPVSAGPLFISDDPFVYRVYFCGSTNTNREAPGVLLVT